MPASCLRHCRRLHLTSRVLMACTCTLLPAALAAQAPATATVTVDRAATIGVSRFDTGVVHATSQDFTGDAAAIAAARKVVAASCGYQCVAIMGWGALNPEPSPGVYDWSTLDARVGLMRALPGVTPVITLCAAPDWMKGGEPGKTNWKNIEVAPLESHFGDFADLAAHVARRYPDIHCFQVWNEFKGLWDPSHNNWDAALYTRLYNRVYDALKAVNPQIQVGGPYLVLEGDGLDPAQWWGGDPISARNQQVLRYWLQHKHGADFIVLDRSLLDYHDRQAHSLEALMAKTSLAGSICDQVRAMTDLPIWFAEFYGSDTRDRKVYACQMASLLRQLTLHGASAAFLWQGQDTHPPGWPSAFYTSTLQAGGGQPYPLADVLRLFHQKFGPGTALYKTTTSTSDIEALASAQDVLLINRSGTDYRVSLQGEVIPLPSYRVRLLERRLKAGADVNARK